LYEDSEGAMISAMSNRITHKPTALAAAHTCVAAQASTVAQDTTALDTSDAQALIVQLMAQIQSQQTQLKFEQTRNAALNLESRSPEELALGHQ
jgi:hypothetical protein